MNIAIDFDGTIVENKYPQMGKPLPFVFDTLKKMASKGHNLILWTCREGELLQEAVELCRKNGVEFYAINKNYPEEKDDYKVRKLTADLFIDDRNFGGFIGWGEIWQKMELGEALPKKKRGWFW